MGSKDNTKENNFKRRVITHMKKEGFNCIAQPTPAFPEIMAWRPFADSGGNMLAINVQETISEKIKNKIVLPFYVAFVNCKGDKSLNKKEKERAKLCLKEGRCNAFFVANKDGRKLLFNEITVNSRKSKKKTSTKERPSYVG